MRIYVARGLFALLLVAAGCSGSGGGAPRTSGAGAGGASGGGAGSGGEVGTAGAAGGGSEAGMGGSGGMEPTTGSGGTAGVDASGAAGSGGGTAGAVGTDAGGGGAPGVDGGTPQSFTCSLILGAGQTNQWYGAFEGAAGTAKWEIKATDNTFIEAWANPASNFWGLATQSPCAANATMPDRVLLIVYSKTITAEADWEMQINKVVANIKAKFSSVKQIELLTMARGPGNTMCGTAVATLISAAQDQAMKAVADGSAGTIKVGPQYFVPTCAAFATANNTNLTPSGATAVAQMLAAVYK